MYSNPELGEFEIKAEITPNSFGYGSDVPSTPDLKYDIRNPNNPFSPFSAIPLPAVYGSYGEYNIEPAFIRKRNERERERVRCVNDGYVRLREALPLENKDKRISKVETLRSAIRYIQHLQGLLVEVAKDKKVNKKDKNVKKKDGDNAEMKTENKKHKLCKVTRS